MLARIPIDSASAGAMAPALANWGCHQKFQRVMMEKLLGIHRDKLLPDFAAETFDKWLRRTGLPAVAGGAGGEGRDFPDLLHQLLQPRAGQGGGRGICEKRMRGEMPEAELLRDAGARRRRRRVRAQASAGEYRFDAAAGARGLQNRGDQSDLLADDARGISATCSAATRSGSSPRRWSIRTSCSTSCIAPGKFNKRVSVHARHDRVSRPVPSEGAGYRIALARPDAPDSRRGSNHSRCMHGA